MTGAANTSSCSVAPEAITPEVMSPAPVCGYRRRMDTTTMRPVGEMLRDWRQRRRLSQLELAGEAGISTRHISFLETGRSLPSREMLMRLLDRLAVPLRERNTLMVAAGYAPLYGQRSLSEEAMRAVREAVEQVLSGHEPYPALAVDRHWTLIRANRAVQALLVSVDPALLAPPVNVLRVSLHPDGLAPRIMNFRQWRAHLLERLRGQLEATGDPALADLLQELRRYPAPAAPATENSSSGTQPARLSSTQWPAASCGGPEALSRHPSTSPDAARNAAAMAIVVPLRLAVDAGVLSLISTTTVFGTPLDVTLSELALESFFPADAATAEILRGLAQSAP